MVVGGALSGAATALQLRRQAPGLTVAVVEKSTSFSRRVGESTVEVSGHFLGKELGFGSYLGREHIAKQGMRFYFRNDRAGSLYGCSEVGPVANVRLPAYQVDRAKLDEKVLAQAVEEGAQLFRPAKVKAIRLVAGGTQEVDIATDTGEALTLKARWVVDASGQVSLLGRQLKLLERNDEHPVSSVWGRFRGVEGWDARPRRKEDFAWTQRTTGIRDAATNHIVGDGYWMWVIALANGEYSIGVVYDERLVSFPKEGRLADRLTAFIRSHPAGNDFLGDGEVIAEDVHARGHFAYRAKQFIGDGWALVGDAAAFIDPFYSPGMDWIAFTTGATAELIARKSEGIALQARIDRHNQRFALSYDRWFRAVYKDKYVYQGDLEFMDLAFRLDLGLYYVGIVQPVLRSKRGAWNVPPFSHERATWPARIMALYNRRLAAMAAARRRRGTFGRRNAGEFRPFTSFDFTWRLRVRLALLLGRWLCLECREGWRSWFRQAAVAPVDTSHVRARGRRETILASAATPTPSS